ncbi:MAG: ATP-dependent RNA helicase HrpA [Planctomycetota bacterium]
MSTHQGQPPPASEPADQPTIEDAWPADRELLRRQRRRGRRGSAAARAKQRARYDELLAESAERWRRRRSAAPAPSFAADLPVLERRGEIEQAILDNPVVIVCGETGSGKSTQLPQICLAAGRGVDGFIGHTQPRRIAARSIAQRVAEELGSPVGRDVGYKVRFHDETAPHTFIKLMTDGVLLAEAQGDRLFQRYDTLIIDEAHERSLNIDLLLGLLPRVLERRPEFRLIITSATIDAERFSEHFTIAGRAAPIIEVSGRTFPVDVRYEPPEDREGDSNEPARHAADAAERLLADNSGDVLVFLPTERDIREAARLLRSRPVGRGVEVLPLYARLSTAQQQRVFTPTGRRRVVLATNVAESSLTVPGIRCVVDTGTARLSRFSAKRRLQRLPIEAISQASANQRAGRCGRVGPGVCVRLYSEEDFDSRPQYTTPEIRRTNLAGAMLRLKTLSLGDVADLPLLDRPRPEAIREARRTLHELQAIDDDGELTDRGRAIGRMPVDPRVGRMLLAAAEENCLTEILIIAAALETQDPRERPVESTAAADESHSRFIDPRSDFLGMVNLWRHLRRLRSELSRNRFKRACAQQFLSVAKVLEWEDVHRQLLLLVKQQRLTLNREPASYGAVHRTLLAGLLSGVALLRGDEGYESQAGEGLQVWPGSALRGVSPKWIVAAESVETSRRYLRTVARLRPEWLPAAGAHLVKRRWENPRWSRRRQVVMASERLTLFGLPLPDRRAVVYGPIAPRVSREVFVREALVDEGLRGEWDFLLHNRAALAQLRRIDAKVRPTTPLVDEATLFDFYNERLPHDVLDLKTFRTWFGRDDGQGDRALRLDVDEMASRADEQTLEGFPDNVETGGALLPIDYGRRDGRDDGPVITVPEALAPTLDIDLLEWGLPGQLRDRVVALIRGLPKPLRTRLVPAPDVAARVAGGLPFGRGVFAKTLAVALSQAADADVPPAELCPTRLPAKLQLRVRIENEQGECLADGLTLAEVRQRWGQPSMASGPRVIADPQWSDEPVDTWRFGTLPDSVPLQRGAPALRGVPGLVDFGDGAAVRLFAARPDADHASRAGVLRLLACRLRAAAAEQVEWLPEWSGFEERLRRVLPDRDLRNEAAELLIARAASVEGRLPRSSEAFQQLAADTENGLPVATQDSTKPLVSLLRGLVAGWERLTAGANPLPEAARRDMIDQLNRLAPTGFLTAITWQRLLRYPCYLQAVGERIRRVDESGAAKDQRLFERVAPELERLASAEQSEAGQIDPGELDSYRWMIEEFRVSVFAPKLGTQGKVSAKRLEEQWRRCLRNQ